METRHAQIAMRLSEDREFRQSFIISPRETLQKSQIILPEKDIQKIESFMLHKRRQNKSFFNDIEVLRCSVGY